MNDASTSHPFDLTHDWISDYFPLWDRLLPPGYASPPSILEIGCYEGRASVWFLQRYSGCDLTVIDTFEGGADHKEAGLDFSDVERRFRHNTSPWQDQVTLRHGSSASWLRAFPARPNFDLVLVDGSHLACDVLSDLILLWPTVTPGGIVIMDDYGWGGERPPYETPGPAIDSFLRCHKGQYDLFELGYQVIVRKRGGA